ncbi:uncharacterized protein [Venturia canescens]|uniref:uncharacterized protein n=1 Tax=Venturia canescens TaxID=32260 RepID=UPI001C9CC3BE|nr:uncharacterized protein LOC122416579 [Venturia canescens]
MKGRNYAAILLLVIGILEVYSHPQTFNAQDAEELARSLQTVGGDELTDEAYFYDLSDRESYSSADKHADREDGRSKRSPGASKKTPEKLQELRQELNRTNAAPVVARRTNSQRREDRDVVTRRYNAAVADLMQREHMTRAAAVQYLLQHNMQLVNDYLIAQGM